MSSADVLNKVETVTCKIEWKLQDLHRYRDFVANETFFNSKQFYNPQYPTAAWELRVYFNAYSNLITLAQVKQTLKVKYVLYALDVRGGRVNISSVTPHDFNRFKETIRYTIDMERLMHTDGSVLLFCELEFLPHNLKRGRKLKRKHEEISNFSTPNFQKLLINMFEQETLTDCVINIENQKINTHRCILAQNSEVFFRMFEHGGMLEAQNGQINIVDSSFECFLAMIKYFYSGEVDKDSLEKFSEELFTIAEKYLVLPLKEICERFMASGIGQCRLQMCSIRVMSHDFNRFIETWKRKLDMERLIHADGSVLLVCEIRFLPQNLKRSRKLKCGFNDISNFSSANFQKLMSNMFEQETLTDCVINIENQKINAHRCILAQNSEVFLRMFEQDGMLEAQNVYFYKLIRYFHTLNAPCRD
uniref:BTB domain-containing protein n=1 Tax=Meloidogyne incognita TaxID=6306 RepID=A0A914L3S7_MELIC